MGDDSLIDLFLLPFMDPQIGNFQAIRYGSLGDITIQFAGFFIIHLWIQSGLQKNSIVEAKDLSCAFGGGVEHFGHIIVHRIENHTAFIVHRR